MKKIIFFLILTQNVFSQDSLFPKINQALKQGDLNPVSIKFNSKSVFNDFSKHYSGLKNISIEPIKIVKQSKSRRVRQVGVFVNESGKKTKVDEFLFYNEIKQNIEFINYTTENSKDYALYISNYIQGKIDLPYFTSESKTLDELDSLGRAIEKLFKKDKMEFMEKYFKPENCANNIGDSWAARDFEKKVELMEVQYYQNYFDAKINAGFIVLSLVFENSPIGEMDILHFVKTGQKFQYTYSSQTFELSKILR